MSVQTNYKSGLTEFPSHVAHLESSFSGMDTNTKSAVEKVCPSLAK